MTGVDAPAITYTNNTQAFEILSTATVSTTGNDAVGIYGYGAGPYALINSSGSIKTVGDYAHALHLVMNNTVGIAQFEGTISTSGTNAYGIFSTASASTWAYAGILSKASISTTGANSYGLYATTSMDATATATTVAEIAILNNGAISTQGQNAVGIYAVTYGGAVAATNNIAVTSNKSISTFGEGAAGIAIYNNLGGAIGAGTVTVNSTGAISTAGAYADGISVYNGATGPTTITTSGIIRTSGEGSSGIYAASNNGSAVTISTGAAITSTGLNANGIYAVAVGNTTNLTIQANADITTTGAGSIAILAIANSAHAQVDIGPNAKVSAPDGGAALDIRAATAAVTNSGTISGDIYVTAPGATVTNASTGTINSGAVIDLSSSGASGTLTNSGTLSPGGTGMLRTTTLTGDYVQSATGKLLVDASWQTGTSDQFAVTGTATVAGTIIVNPINLGSAAGMTRNFTILTAAGGVIDNGISVANSAAAVYELLKPDANTIGVKATINFQGFGVGGLNANQNALGGALNTVFAGGGSLAFMPTLLTLGAGEFAAALKQLGPTGDSAKFAGAIQTGNTFANHLLSCRQAGDSNDASRFIREGQCVWARIGARRLENDGRTGGFGYGETSNFVSGGAQLRLHGDWKVGGAIGYEQSNMTTNTRASSQADRLHLGGVVKYTPGPWMLAASVTGGHGWHDNNRRVAFGGFAATATSKHESDFIAGRLTAAYLLSRGEWYLKPQIEVASTSLMRDSYSEHATGGVGLRVASSSVNVLSAAPSVEIGAEHRFQGAMYRAFVRGGATFRDKDTFVTTASFADAPSVPFATATRIDKITADLGAGFDVFMPGGTNVRVQYDGQFGQRTTSHAGSAKLAVPF